MNKTHFKTTASVSWDQVVDFIVDKSGLDYIQCSNLLEEEIDGKIYSTSKCELMAVELLDDYRIYKVRPKYLKGDGYLIKFTQTIQLYDDYYILYLA